MFICSDKREAGHPTVTHRLALWVVRDNTVVIIRGREGEREGEGAF